MTIVSDAYRFLLPIFIVALILSLAGHPAAGAVLFFVLGGFVLFFFRSPARSIPPDERLVLSPADGKVVRVLESDAREGGGPGQVVSIFLNIFDVHVTRSPISGTLESVEYKRGRFKAAFDHAASTVNEQNVLVFDGQGIRLVVKQIAGLIARRVVCWKKPGTSVQRGELVGLIRFGSRVDILVPAHVRLRVKVGDRVKAGTSVIGELT